MRNKNLVKKMKKKSLMILLFSTIIGGILFYGLQGFACYGIIDGFPICAFITYEGTLEGKISDWIWDNKPWETSIGEITKPLFLLALSVGSIFGILYGLTYIKFLLSHDYRKTKGSQSITKR